MGLPDGSPTQEDPIVVEGLLSLEDEEALVDTLLLKGWEQGCWLDDRVAAHSMNAQQQRALFAATAQRLAVHREQHLAGQGCTIPEMLPHNSDEPDGVIWVIVTQRCDLIKGLRQEPTVTLVRATKWAAQDAKDKARRSPHLYVMHKQGDGVWVADFRELIIVPKAALKDYQPRQCLSDGIKARRQFALAYAQRTWRRPVPTDIQNKVQEPLIKMRKQWYNEFYKYISDILVDIEDHSGNFVVYAVIGDSEDNKDETIDEFKLEAKLAKFLAETILPHLSKQSGNIFNKEMSAIIPTEDLTMTRVFKTYKLDLNYFSSDEGDAPSQL